MFASLRFPDGTEYPEITVTDRGIPYEIPESLNLTDRQKKAILRFLPKSCPDPAVLSYRAEFAEELNTSPEINEIFRVFSSLGDALPTPSHTVGTVETERLRTVTVFESFAARYDDFCRNLTEIAPKSTAAKRCFRFCRNYGESFEYKELKIKAAELRQSLGFASGFSLAVGNPIDGTGTARLKKESTEPEGIRFTANRLIAEFGGTAPAEDFPPCRPYTDMETAVLTGIIRKDPKLARRLEEFCDLYAAAGTDDLLRLSEESLFFTGMNELYRAGQAKGYSLCRPVFRNPGFYSQIIGLCYKTASDTVEKADYITTPLNHITVVCGPDSEEFVKAVGIAHLCASSGGLVFAQEAQFSPINRLETDHNERIRTEGLNENSLCLCSHLFDVMLPRQEEAAVSEVLLRLADRNTRGVVRICSKSNLAVLQKQIDGNKLPSCTMFQAGTDRTLEELLQRHRLTKGKEADA